MCGAPYDHNLRLASFDISNMYTNIPTHKLLSTTDTACNKNLVEERLKRDIINLSKTIVDQNYFQFILQRQNLRSLVNVEGSSQI